MDAMESVGQKSVRIFISATPQNYKGSSSVAVDDLETVAVGHYDDTILHQIDELMFEAWERGVKLDIAMHDRYALGCWSKDAYVDTYGLPDGYPGCNLAVNKPTKFYTDAAVQQQFDQRLEHILQHRNPHFQNRPWATLHEAVLSFSPENEAQGHMTSVDWGWWCRRAKAMKKHIGSSGVLISTGGSTDLEDAVNPQLYQCHELDVVDIHTYRYVWSPAATADYVRQAVALAAPNNLRLRLQEFGVQGDDDTKAAALDAFVSAMNQIGVPFLPWELMLPGNDQEFEFAASGKTWASIARRSQETLGANGLFTWPEIC